MSVNHYLSWADTTSQIYLNKYLIVTACVVIKLYIFKESLSSAFEAASEMYSCDDSSIQQLPQNLSKLVNSTISQSLQSLENNYLILITMAIKVVKNMVIFYVEVFLGTYTCLLNAAVSGTTDFAFDSAESLIKMVNSTIVGVTEDLQDGLDGLSTVINTLASAVKGIKDFFTGSNSSSQGDEYKNKISLSIGVLQNISIPSSVLTDIEDFRNKVIDFDDLQNATQELIAVPFNLASSKLSTTLNKTKILNGTQLPTMGKIDSICKNSTQVEAIFHNLKSQMNHLLQIVIIALFAAAFLFSVFLAVHDWIKWRHLNEMVDELNSLKPSSTVTTMNVLNKYSNKFIYYLQKWKVVRNPRIYWLMSYMSSPYAVNVLLIGLAGLLMCLLQYLLLKKTSKSLELLYPTEGEEDRVMNQVKTVAGDYFNEMNQYLVLQSAVINDELFGNVRNISSSLSDSIDVLITNLNNTVTTLFGNTPFSSPVQTVVYCTIGRKLETIESGLNWVNNNLQVKIPSLDASVKEHLVNTTALSEPVTKAIETGFKAVIETYRKSLALEFYISIALVGLWFLQLLIGILVIVMKSNRMRKSMSAIANHVFPLSSNESNQIISDPRKLTLEEKHCYEYPITSPFRNSYFGKDYSRGGTNGCVAHNCEDFEKPPTYTSSSVYSDSQLHPTRSTSMRQNRL